MLAPEVLGEGKVPAEKPGGRLDRVGRDRRDHKAPLLLGQVNLAAGLEPEFAAQGLGDQDLPLF